MTSLTKYIVWDWNGTLQDDLPVSIAATNANLRNVGRPPVNETTYRNAFDVPIDRLYRNLGLTEDEIATRLPSMQKEYFEIYDKLIATVDFRTGAREVLDYASSQGVRHVVLSNHVKHVIANDLRRLKKLEAFHEILAWQSRETQFSHPKGDFLASYMERHALHPENGIVVGDTEEEARLARAQGLICVLISGGYSSLAVLEKAKPDYLIHSLPELKPILKERGLAA